MYTKIDNIGFLYFMNILNSSIICQRSKYFAMTNFKTLPTIKPWAWNILKLPKFEIWKPSDCPTWWNAALWWQNFKNVDPHLILKYCPNLSKIKTQCSATGNLQIWLIFLFWIYAFGKLGCLCASKHWMEDINFRFE